MDDETKVNKFLESFKTFLNESDIRILVFAPFVIGFVPIIVWYLLEPYFPKISIPLPLGYFGLSIFFFILCFSGIAEIYKKEMPGPMGGIAKGKIAVISGVIMLVLFAIPGLTALIYAFISLLNSRLG